MRFNTFIKGFLLIGSLGFCLSCIEKRFPELPPETQTGAETFGCLINNELVYADFEYYGAGIGVQKTVTASASYDRSIDLMQISAKCQLGQQFVFVINNPYSIPYRMTSVTPIDTVRYLPPNASDRIEAARIGNLNLTRIDSLTKIVSGTFFFDLNEAGKTPIHVTKGRFDLTFYSY